MSTLDMRRIIVIDLLAHRASVKKDEGGSESDNERQDIQNKLSGLPKFGLSLPRQAKLAVLVSVAQLLRLKKLVLPYRFCAIRQ
jgi:hypothetical protein